MAVGTVVGVTLDAGPVVLAGAATAGLAVTGLAGAAVAGTGVSYGLMVFMGVMAPVVGLMLTACHWLPGVFGGGVYVDPT